MDRVLDRLWIGATEDFQVPLSGAGFTALLDLRDGKHPTREDVAVHRIDNRDGDPWTPRQVTDALDFITDRIKSGRVLVACAAGMSRSASIVIGYLLRTGWDLPSAYETVRRARPRIQPAAKMLTSVICAIDVTYRWVS